MGLIQGLRAGGGLRGGSCPTWYCKEVPLWALASPQGLTYSFWVVVGQNLRNEEWSVGSVCHLLNSHRDIQIKERYCANVGNQMKKQIFKENCQELVARILPLFPDSTGWWVMKGGCREGWLLWKGWCRGSDSCQVGRRGGTCPLSAATCGWMTQSLKWSWWASSQDRLSGTRFTFPSETTERQDKTHETLVFKRWDNRQRSRRNEITRGEPAVAPALALRVSWPCCRKKRSKRSLVESLRWGNRAEPGKTKEAGVRGAEHREERAAKTEWSPELWRGSAWALSSELISPHVAGNYPSGKEAPKGTKGAVPCAHTELRTVPAGKTHISCGIGQPAQGSLASAVENNSS